MSSARWSRRRVLRVGAAAGAAWLLSPAACRSAPPAQAGVVVNDVHSQLNETRVRRVVRPSSEDELADTVRRAAGNGEAVTFAGGRHAAGGQQFATDGVLVDMRGMNRVLAFDAAAGVVEAEAGVLWPELMDELARRQAGASGSGWGIVQKQGTDRMTLGGSLGANIHGNGLGLPPIVAQVESFRIVDAAGEVRTCSRDENADLFRLAVGGYGLFGAMTSVRLRLAPRRRLRSSVRMADVGDVVPALEVARAEGAMYGDWHFSTDASSDGYLTSGVLAVHRPLEASDPESALDVIDSASALDAPLDDPPDRTAEWLRLVVAAHADRRGAFGAYADSALRRDASVVWSDDFQRDRAYVDGYHAEVDRALGARTPGTESLVEFYVPRAALPAFLDDLRADLLRHGADLIYGTVRMVERDDETFLPWAREAVACTALNFHVVRDDAGVRSLAATYRRVVDLAARHGGTFYLTYHGFATREQVERCHPQMRAFLAAKRERDPQDVFRSDWYRRLSALFD